MNLATRRHVITAIAWIWTFGFLFSGSFGFVVVFNRNHCSWQKKGARLLQRRMADKEGGLEVAGSALVSASQSLSDGTTNTEQAALLESAGKALVGAGENWTVDWSLVTAGFDLAAPAFYDLSQSVASQDPAAVGIYYEIAQELEDASGISGCTSIGPSTAVPNMEAVRDSLAKLALVFDTDETLSAQLLEASNAIAILLDGFD